MNDFYTRLKRNLIGFDGGNIHSSLWFSGLEWGRSDEEITDKMTRYTYTSSSYEIPYLSPEWKNDNPNFYKWQFDQKIAKILCHVFNFEGSYKVTVHREDVDNNSSGSG